MRQTFDLQSDFMQLSRDKIFRVLEERSKSCVALLSQRYSLEGLYLYTVEDYEYVRRNERNSTLKKIIAKLKGHVRWGMSSQVNIVICSQEKMEEVVENFLIWRSKFTTQQTKKERPTAGTCSASSLPPAGGNKRQQKLIQQPIKFFQREEEDPSKLLQKSLSDTECPQEMHMEFDMLLQLVSNPSLNLINLESLHYYISKYGFFIPEFQTRRQLPVPPDQLKYTFSVCRQSKIRNRGTYDLHFHVFPRAPRRAHSVAGPSEPGEEHALIPRYYSSAPRGVSIFVNAQEHEQILLKRVKIEENYARNVSKLRKKNPKHYELATPLPKMSYCQVCNLNFQDFREHIASHQHTLTVGHNPLYDEIDLFFAQHAQERQPHIPPSQRLIKTPKQLLSTSSESNGGSSGDITAEISLFLNTENTRNNAYKISEGNELCRLQAMGNPRVTFEESIEEGILGRKRKAGEANIGEV